MDQGIVTRQKQAVIVKLDILGVAVAFFLAGSVPFSARAQISPDYIDSSGDWSISGAVIGHGNTIVCKMQKSAENGSAFAYVDVFGAGTDGMGSVKALFVTKSGLPEDSAPTVTLFFDGVRRKSLIGGVNSGYLHIDLAAGDVDELGRLLELLKSSSKLTEVASFQGHLSETTNVDLADSNTAFDAAGLCMKAVLGLATARLQRNSGQ